ncbi:MAG: GTP-binding protein [Candidatus Lokiarchaeota archaeon]|nr:GTP-binding protein [Candidatus Lokiarchaeota archaeon]
MIDNGSKCIFIGEGGVGKTSLLRLLQGKEIQIQRIPTIGVDVEKIDFEECENNTISVMVWDFGGQKRFQFLWDEWIKGSGLTVVVTDSSEKNVNETKTMLEKYGKKLGSEIIAIANKQDLVGSLTPEEVSKRLGVKTYGMIAIKRSNMEAMRDIILSQTKKELILTSSGIVTAQ